MIGRVRVLCGSAASGGFALAGFRPVEAADPEAGTLRLLELLRQPGIGVILVEDTIHDALPSEVRRQIARQPVPMIVPFPSARWAAAAAPSDTYITELLRQAIGYRVRLL